MDKCNPGAIVVFETYLNVFHYSCVRSQAHVSIPDYPSKMDMTFKNCCPNEISHGTICRSFRARCGKNAGTRSLLEQDSDQASDPAVPIEKPSCNQYGRLVVSIRALWYRPRVPSSCSTLWRDRFRNKHCLKKYGSFTLQKLGAEQPDLPDLSAGSGEWVSTAIPPAGSVWRKRIRRIRTCVSRFQRRRTCCFCSIYQRADREEFCS